MNNNLSISEVFWFEWDGLMGHGNFQWSGRSKALGAVCDDVLYCDFAKTGLRRDAKKNVNEVKSPTHQKEYSDL